MLSMNLQLFGCASCNSWCDNSCAINCGTGCNAGCDGGCGGGCGMQCSTCGSGCTGACKGGCLNSCTGSCDGNCKGSCDDTCKGGCKGGCGSCTGCTGCGGACSYSCTGSCDDTCKDGCKGDCDNACKSTEASNVIANLASNISRGNKIQMRDFISLKNAIHNELKRRNKSLPNDDIDGKKVLAEHAQKIFDDIKFINSSKAKNIVKGECIKADTLSEAKTYIQTLMTENIKK